MTIPAQCEWPVRDVARGPFHPCGVSLRYDTPDGVKTVVMWSSSRARHLGPCHFARAGEGVVGQADLMYPGWRAFTVHVDTDEEAAMERSRERFRWTLTDVVQPRNDGRGGLVRADNSGVVDEWQPVVRRVE